MAERPLSRRAEPAIGFAEVSGGHHSVLLL